MRINIFLFLALVLSLVACSTSEPPKKLLPDQNKRIGGLGLVGYSDDNETDKGLSLYANTLPKLAKVEIEQRFKDDRPGTNQENGDYEFDECVKRANRPTEEDIKEFFAKAFSIGSYQALEVLDYPHCWAFGKVTFIDGSKGAWRMSVTGQGWLSFPDEWRDVFYCVTCDEGLFTLDDLNDATLIKYGHKAKAEK